MCVGASACMCVCVLRTVSTDKILHSINAFIIIISIHNIHRDAAFNDHMMGL